MGWGGAKGFKACPVLTWLFNRRFDALMSRCSMPRAWQKSRPSSSDRIRPLMLLAWEEQVNNPSAAVDLISFACLHARTTHPHGAYRGAYM